MEDVRRADRAEAPARGGLIVLVVGLGFVIANLDATVVNVATVTIGRDLDAGVSQVAWVVNAYVLAFAMFLLVSGDLAGRFGPRRVFLAGVGVFMLASIASALSTSAPMLIAARFFQGFGAALFQPASLVLLTAAFPDERTRARMIGLYGAMGAAAAGLGPAIGGLLVAVGGWQVLFWINIPIGLVVIIVGRLVLPQTSGQAGRGIPVVGHAILALILLGATYALMQGPEQGWTAPLVISGIVLAVAGGAGFGVWQRRSPRKIYPGRLLRNRQFNAANLIGFLLNIGMYGTVFLISYLLQTVRGASVQETGLQLLPMMLGFVVGNLGFARVATRMGTRTPLIVGMGIATLATLTLALAFSDSTPIWVIAATVGITNLGLGIVSPAMTAALMNAVTPADAGTAGAMLNLNRNIGSLIGVAVFAGILQTTTDWYASGALALGVATVSYALACATAFTTRRTAEATAGGRVEEAAE